MQKKRRGREMKRGDGGGDDGSFSEGPGDRSPCNFPHMSALIWAELPAASGTMLPGIAYPLARASPPQTFAPCRPFFSLTESFRLRQFTLYFFQPSSSLATPHFFAYRDDTCAIAANHPPTRIHPLIPSQ
jgi:hypothetical protein